MPKLLMAFSAIVLALAAPLATAGPAASQIAFGIRIESDIPPPPLPVYDQPPLPGPGYIWTPGYWAWDDDAEDYYWVPGTWVEPPEPGLLWTPGYWASSDDVYVFNEGYWAPECGFYGGVAYGFGYTGVGYDGGYWDNSTFYYNSYVTNIVNITIVNVYSRAVPFRQTPPNSFSYNGPGGLSARATSQQIVTARGPHVRATALQLRHETVARSTPALFVAHNRGQPQIGSTAQPGVLRGPGTLPSRALTTTTRSLDRTVPNGQAKPFHIAPTTMDTNGHPFPVVKGPPQPGSPRTAAPDALRLPSSGMQKPFVGRELHETRVPKEEPRHTGPVFSTDPGQQGTQPYNPTVRTLRQPPPQFDSPLRRQPSTLDRPEPRSVPQPTHQPARNCGLPGLPPCPH